MEGQGLQGDDKEEVKWTYVIVSVTVRHKGEIGTVPKFGEYSGDGEDAHENGYCGKNQYALEIM
jgi:hypothetical protein